jgi:hypothetical protein
VAYAASSGSSLDLVVDGAYIVQSSQTYRSGVPLVTGRDGELRVFVRATEANTAAPIVRARFYRDTTLVDSLTLQPTAIGATNGVPLSIDQLLLSRSWNATVPGRLIVPGMRMIVEVNPDHVVPERNPSNNLYPTSGTPMALDVRTVPTTYLTLIPIFQKGTGVAGNVTAGNIGQYTSLTSRIHPVSSLDVQLHSTYTTSVRLTPDDINNSWEDLLSELQAVWLAEDTTRDTSRTYYGVAHVTYASGVAGIGYIGEPVAMGWDHLPAGSEVMAHELGHTWGREHSPCGGPAGVDPNYPYADGRIGVFGFDVAQQVLHPDSDHDVMAYCSNVWISDYTYKGVLDWLIAHPQAPASAASRFVQPCLLVWGTVKDGQLRLEPPIEVRTRPHLPSKAGSQQVTGLAADGGTVFSLAFEPAPIADGKSGSAAFAFALPLSERDRGRLQSLRASSGAQVAVSEETEPARVAVQRQSADQVQLTWDAAKHPVLMVRDARNGEVLSLARQGSTIVRTTSDRLELQPAGRMRSAPLRVVVPR